MKSDATASAPPPIPKDLVGVFLRLAQEHREAAAALAAVQANPDQREALWPAVKAVLVPHEKGEVREVFPVLRQAQSTREDADHHDDEARELEAMIYQLDLLEPATETWGALFDQLAATVLHHAIEEETEIFPAAQEALGEAVVVALEGTYLDAKLKVLAAV